MKNNKTNLKRESRFWCGKCGSKDLLIPSWSNQDRVSGQEPDVYSLDGDCYCENCQSIVWADDQNLYDYV